MAFVLVAESETEPLLLLVSVPSTLPVWSPVVVSLVPSVLLVDVPLLLPVPEPLVPLVVLAPATVGVGVTVVPVPPLLEPPEPPPVDPPEPPVDAVSAVNITAGM